MRKHFLVCVQLLLMFSNLFSQKSARIYLFPGQGSDKRIFDSLTIDTSFETTIIEYGTPEKGMTMRSFALSLLPQIDTTKEFILAGVSLGGMICVELGELLRPQKNIIISSAKNRKELPARYRFQRYIPLYKIFPGFVLLAGAKMLQPIVEPDRKKNKKTFKSMLNTKDARYMKNTIGLIVNWDRECNFKSVYHIHGTNDHTLPLRKIKEPVLVINGGSHMMTLVMANKVSEKLNEVLKRINK